MDPEMTTEQNKQLITWAEKRDELLLEISNARSELERLQKLAKESAESKTDIEVEMNIIIGRIEELKNREKDLFPLVSKDISELKAEKATLQAEITGFKNLIEELRKQEAQLKTDVDFELTTFQTLRDEALGLEKVIGEIIKVSNGNAGKIESIVSYLETSLKEMIEVNKKNVEETNIVIDKVPKMLVELRKNKLIKGKI